MEDRPGTEHVETLIIGGGQAGLATGYFLKERGRPFLILDAGERVGDAWRNRWESLRLFTPARFDRLPGSPFPASSWYFPTKDEMGDYLEEYVQRFDLPVRTGVRVERLAKEGGRFVMTSPQGRFEAENVVVATGACQNPKVPGFAGKLSPNITQLHSKDYQSPSQLREGDVLVVGVGNSGAEISKELSKSRRTLLAGKESGHLPVRHGSIPSRYGFRVFRFLGHRVLTKGTPIGRKMRSEADRPRRSADPRQAEGPRRCRHRAGPPGRGRRGRSAGSRRRPRPGRGERDLVHRVPLRVRLDRSARPGRRMESRSTIVGSSGRNPVSTSSAWRSSTHSHQTSSPAWRAITPSWPTTSPRAPGRARAPFPSSTPRGEDAAGRRGRRAPLVRGSDSGPSCPRAGLRRRFEGIGHVAHRRGVDEPGRETPDPGDRAAVRGRLVRSPRVLGGVPAACRPRPGAGGDAAGPRARWRDRGHRSGLDRGEPTVRRARRIARTSLGRSRCRGHPLALLHAATRRSPRRARLRCLRGHPDRRGSHDGPLSLDRSVPGPGWPLRPADGGGIDPPRACLDVASRRGRSTDRHRDDRRARAACVTGAVARRRARRPGDAVRLQAARSRRRGA